MCVSVCVFVVCCDSDEDGMELKYAVVLSESQCIAQPFSTNVTVSVVLFFNVTSLCVQEFSVR